MNLRSLFTVAVIAAFSCSPVQADEALNKLMNGHEQAVRTARLPLHRKLLTELQKLETQYVKEGNAALAEVRTELSRVKDWITEASLPMAGGTGPQPGDFKILYGVGDSYVFGTWENGTLKTEAKGFSWVNNGPTAAVTNTRSLAGAFEATIIYVGTIAVFSAMEADYMKYLQMYFTAPVDNAKHTIKLKRTAAGAMTADLDGKPIVLNPNNGGRPDMIVRLCLHVVKGAKLHLVEMSIKDLSGKK